jgi:LmbE family N-acetylglucosaminyl deacetylase
VKLVSVTNGDIGHWQMAGGPLAQRRTAESAAAAKILGVRVEVLDIHDGELEPTLENRRTITRLIRDWHADIVIAHRPWDYHPDHRYVGVLVQDAAFMVTVPFFCPDTPPLTKNPVFLYSSDRFAEAVSVPGRHRRGDRRRVRAESRRGSRAGVAGLRRGRQRQRGIRALRAARPATRPAAAAGSRSGGPGGRATKPTATAPPCSSGTARRKARRSSTPRPSKSANTAASPAARS